MDNKPSPNPANKLPLARLMFYLGITAISILFITLTIAYATQRHHWQWQGFPFPKMFYVSTLAILLSSYTMQATTRAFKRSDTERFQVWLVSTIVLGALFMLGQCLGWYALQKNGIFFGGKLDGAYLYLLSGLHALHAIVGWILLLYLWQKTHRLSQQPIEKTLFFAEPLQHTRVDLIALYWHFVDILWIYLMLFLLFNRTSY